MFATGDEGDVGRATYKRAVRVADQIRMEVADILMRRIKDPRVGFVTVTDVDVTNDLRLARIYITTMQTGEAEGEAFAGLAKAGGFIRAELGRRLNLRYTPELVFMKDKAGERGDRVLSLLDNLSSPNRETQLEGGSDPSEGTRDA